MLFFNKQNNEAKKPRVLIVDDNAYQLRLRKESLSEKYDIILANSGRKALTSIGFKKPDVIVLDYDMPGLTGIDVLQEIRDDKKAKDMPVIFLTGIDDAKHRQMIDAMKPFARLLKPVSSDRLSAVIDEALASC